MDCRTARLFVYLQGSGTGELAGPEAEELSIHLSACGECSALAGDECRVDQQLGKAMNDIEIPAGLHLAILQRLDTQRRSHRRRWLGHASRGALAAALLLAAGIGIYLWFSARPGVIKLDQIATTLGPSSQQWRAIESVNASLARLGDHHPAPPFVNYAYLAAAPSIAELPGHDGVKVPQLIFSKERDNPREADHFAIVFILDQSRFRLDEQSLTTSDNKYKVFEAKRDRDHCTYLVLYTGDNWDWLKVHEELD